METYNPGSPLRAQIDYTRQRIEALESIITTKAAKLPSHVLQALRGRLRDARVELGRLLQKGDRGGI